MFQATVAFPTGSGPTTRLPLKPSSHSMTVSASPSNTTVKPVPLVGSTSACQGQLWTVVLTAVAIFFASI